MKKMNEIFRKEQMDEKMVKFDEKNTKCTVKITNTTNTRDRLLLQRSLYTAGFVGKHSSLFAMEASVTCFMSELCEFVCWKTGNS